MRVADILGVPLTRERLTARQTRRQDLDLLVLENVRIRAWDRTLFVECGDGWIAEEAWRRARRGYVVGVDASPALVARATRLRGIQGVLDFQTWDGQRLPCPTAAFQKVISTCALELCAEPEAMLGEMHRVLQVGGDVYLVELDDSSRRLFGALEQAGFQQARELTRCEIPVDGAEPVPALVLHARRGAA